MQSDEKFEIVDEAGNVTGTAVRSECYRNLQLLHRAVHVLVIIGRGCGAARGGGGVWAVGPGAGVSLYLFIWRTDRESELIMTYRVRSDVPFTPNFEHEWQMYCNYCSAADGVEMSA